MRSRKDEIKVQATLRRDGRVSLTVKLIGYDPLVIGTLEDRFDLTHRIARNIRYAVIELLDTPDQVR